jgi:hypothetical protein
LEKPHIEGVGDERMADGYLFNAGKLQDPVEVIQVQIVTCVQLQPCIDGSVMTVPDPGKFGLDLGPCFGHGIRPCVELDAIGPDCRGSFHEGRLRIHEQAYPNAPCLEAFDSRDKELLILSDIPAVVRGNLAGFGRNKGALCGTNLHDQVKELRPWIPLDVKLNGYHSCQFSDITRSDVALVCPGMHGNALAPCLDTGPGCLDNVRLIAPSSIAQGCYLVDIDAEVDHRPLSIAFLENLKAFSREVLYGETGRVIKKNVPLV